MKAGLYDSARPLLKTCAGSAAKVDLILYASILARLVRCQDEENDRAIMSIMSVTNHKAHEFHVWAIHWQGAEETTGALLREGILSRSRL